MTAGQGNFFVPGQRDSRTRKIFCPGTKGQPRTSHPLETLDESDATDDDDSLDDDSDVTSSDDSSEASSSDSD